MDIFRVFRLRLPGLLLVLALASGAMYVVSLPWVKPSNVSALILAMVGGMLLGNTIYSRLAAFSHQGVTFAKGPILRLSIVLFGFKLTFQDVIAVGGSGILIDGLVLSSTFLLALFLGRKIGLDKQSAMLIGAGSAICGAAAILATEPVVKAHAEKVTVAVATVVVFGTFSMFLYPWLFLAQSHLNISDAAYGVFTGSTVHEVAQVVAASRAISEAAAGSAVITKMIRVMMLAPFLLLLSIYINKSDGKQDSQMKQLCIPWFAFGFLLLVGFNSLNIVSPEWVARLLLLDDVLLAMAMGALGLTTHFSAIKQAGFKPMILAATLFAWLVMGGYLINRGVQALF